MKNLFFGRQEETQNRPLPISERAKEVMHNHFGEGADFYIGLDPAVLLGDPEVVTAGILFIPITLLIAIIMPGNKILPFGDHFALSLGGDFIEAAKVILCTGAKQPRLLPGESEFLGRGVSYCGTCDGMLYRGKKVAVIAQGPEAVSEANFLSGLCSEVHWFGAPQEGVDPRIVLHGEKPEAILGGMKANALQADGQPFAVDGIFIFCPASKPTARSSAWTAACAPPSPASSPRGTAPDSPSRSPRRSVKAALPR